MIEIAFENYTVILRTNNCLSAYKYWPFGLGGYQMFFDGQIAWGKAVGGAK